MLYSFDICVIWFLCHNVYISRSIVPCNLLRVKADGLLKTVIARVYFRFVMSVAPEKQLLNFIIPPPCNCIFFRHYILCLL